MELVFIRGGGLRKIFINKKVINFLTAELNFQPLEIDLNKINEEELKKKKLSDEDIKTIKALSKLGSEEEIARDITKDFQRTGWRKLKRNG